MAKIIDPPSGWMYGYPKEIIDSFGEHFVCRYWEQSEEDNKLDLKDGC
jgi:hypothetical protein